MRGETLFDASGQLVKVRAVMWLAVACAIGGSAWGWSLSQTYGLAPGDGGVLAPAGVRLAVGGTVAALGLLCAAAMGLYSRQYIAQVRRAPGTDHLIIATPGLVGTRETTYLPSEVTIGHARATQAIDDAFGTGIGIRAPWRAVYVPDRRLPLILDGQGRLHGRQDGGR